MDERVLFRDASCETEKKTKGKLSHRGVVDTWCIRDLDAELFSLGEVYLIEPYTVLTDHFCSRSGGFENLAVKIILTAQEGVESVAVSDIRKELVLIERAPRFDHLPPRVLQLTDVITRGINEARG
jgi:hypothetical protein